VAAIRCYNRCGFTVYGVEPQAIRHDGVMYDELLMARQAAARKA
jgi:RimJ/RimL family protein N-acetyltransferase